MARRHKGSLLHSLLDVAQTMPLWANALLAAGLYAGLHTYAGNHPPVMAAALPGQLGQAFIAYLPKLVEYYGQFVLPPIFIVGGLFGVLKRKVNAKKFGRISAAADVSNAIRSLTWSEFEQMVGEALRKQGYSVTETKKGPDGGIDLVLHKGGERFLVQYTGRPSRSAFKLCANCMASWRPRVQPVALWLPQAFLPLRPESSPRASISSWLVGRV